MEKVTPQIEELTLWQLLNSEFICLLIGFILTTIVGTFLVTFFQNKSWQRQTRIDLYRKRYEEGTKFLDELSELVGKRYYLLQKLLWVIEEGNSEKIDKITKEYFDMVTYWNSCYFKNRNKIRLLVSDEMANYFLDYTDDKKPDKPKSLHYKFVSAHRKVMDAQKDISKKEVAANAVRELNWKCSAFLEHLTTDFSLRAERLDLLDVTNLKQSSKANIEKENMV